MLKNPILMALSHVDLTGINAAAWRNFINSPIVLAWYALFVECWIGVGTSGRRQRLFFRSLHPFQIGLLFLITVTDSLSNVTLHPSSTSGAIPMSDSLASPGKI